ncbi:MAG: SET domain-containing protein [Phycisphaerales bacterium]|jgi:SET domain-containing protein
MTSARTRSPARPPLRVERVRNGRGLVATRSFQAGARIIPLHGRVVSARAVWGWWAHDPRRAANCIRFDADRYLDPRNAWGAFANHGCDPNAAIMRERGGLVLRAIRAIRAGDEVLHDYSTLLGADDVWTMRCRCGARRCRGTVRNVARLPASVMRRYLALGAIPRFILDTLGDHA